MSTSTRRPALMWAGAIALVVGLVAGVALWMVAGSRRTQAVENLARAPIGCDTTLDFADTGEYLIFVETTGRLDEVRGDCGAPSEYDVDVVRPPVEVTLIDPGGEQIDLFSRTDDVTYSTDDYVGRSVLSVDVAEAGDHVMRVETESEASFAVSVGRDPNGGVALLRGAAVVAALLGLLIGVGLVAAGSKRRIDVPAGPWTPAQSAPPGQPWPTGAPTQPPYRQPPQAPYSPQPPAGASPVAPPAPFGGGYPSAPAAPQQPYGGGAPGRPQAPYDAGSAGAGRPPGPADGTPGHPGRPSVPTTDEPGGWAPADNPFAPPSGVPQQVPRIPGQPPGPSGPAPTAADGDLGWPTAGETSEVDPAGRDSSQSTGPVDEPVDRWNTAPRRDAPPPPS